uniref:Transposase Tc1-like protein n=1 Tax=Trepomonas sp. PC1 TaxID=1076344 RepID=A0A146KDT2_9EUKA|eukprot:JAP93479.1 Transposase Tc1-like protein [Trepomonas sp. PC1]
MYRNDNVQFLVPAKTSSKMHPLVPKNEGRGFQKGQRMTMYNLMRHDPFASYRIIKWRYNLLTQQSVSKATLSRVAKRYNIPCCVTQRKPVMSEKNAERRVAWALKFQDQPVQYWRRILWTDECMCKLYEPKRAIVHRTKEQEWNSTFLPELFCLGNILQWSGVVWAMSSGQSLWYLSLESTSFQRAIQKLVKTMLKILSTT